VLAATLVVGVVLLLATGIRFGRSYWIYYLSWPFVAVVGGLMFRRLGHVRSASFLELVGLIYGQGLLSFLIIVPEIPLSRNFADSALARIDRVLAFDWVAFEQATRPYSSLMQIAYRSFEWQPGVVILALILACHDRRAWEFVTAAAVAAIITAILFPLAPAEGPFQHYNITPSNLFEEQWTNEIRPLFRQIKQAGLRDLGGKIITGLVSFPSYHAAAGLLFTWAAWPLRRLRWPIALLNLLMLLSALTIGCHYLIDLIAGLIVGAISVWVAVAALELAAPADMGSD